MLCDKTIPFYQNTKHYFILIVELNLYTRYIHVFVYETRHTIHICVEVHTDVYVYVYILYMDIYEIFYFSSNSEYIQNLINLTSIYVN